MFAFWVKIPIEVCWYAVVVVGLQSVLTNYVADMVFIVWDFLVFPGKIAGGK